MFEKVHVWWRQSLSDASVRRRYIQAGGELFDTVNYCEYREYPIYAALFKRWAMWEKEHARRGYHTASPDDFYYYTAGMQDLERDVQVKDLQPIPHAERMRHLFFRQ